MQEENWVEVARRLFCLASAGLLIRSSRGTSMSGGLDIALGDYVGHSPIGVLGPSVVLQGLLAGTIPETPFATSASLPMVRSLANSWQSCQRREAPPSTSPSSPSSPCLANCGRGLEQDRKQVSRSRYKDNQIHRFLLHSPMLQVESQVFQGSDAEICQKYQ